MVLLEDKHGPQPDGGGTAATNVDTDTLGVLEDLVAARTVPGDEGALALATEVLDLVGVLLGEALEAGVQVVAGLGGVLDQVEALDLVDDAAEEQGAGGVTHPGVELAIRLVGPQFVVAEVVTSGLGLLGEGDHVGRGLEVPVLVSPELAGGTDTGLNLVNDHEDVVALGDLTQATEELGRGVVVTTLRLDGLDDDGSRRVVVLLDQTLGLLKAALLLSSVLSSVLVEWVLEVGEGSLGPIEGGDVELVDGLAASGAEGAEQTTVETSLEGHDGQLGSARHGVVHGSLHFLRSELDLGATTLHAPPPHERRLVCQFVCVRARLGREDLVQALGGNLEDAGLEDVGPVVLGEVAKSGTVDDGAGHLGGAGIAQEGSVVVTDGD